MQLTHPHSRLILWGGVMLLIYTIYVYFYPLIPYTQLGGPAFDLEMIMVEGKRWQAVVYVMGLIGLFYAYLQTVRTVQTLGEHGQDLRIWILGGGLVFGIVLLFLYPITALDVFLYVVRGRLWSEYGVSPMTALPNSFPNDPYIGYAGEFGEEVSPYGPLWELTAQIPLRLGITDMVGGVLAMKIISLIAYLAMGVLIGWFARPDHNKYPVSSLTMLTFFTWNPLVLMQGIGNGHNDLLMMAFIVLGLVLWQRDRWVWALVALTLATLVKITGLLLLPLVGIALLRTEPSWRGRLIKGLAAVGIVSVTALGIYALTGPLPDVLLGVQFALFGRRGFAPADALRMVLRESYPREWIEPLPAQAARDLFILYYAYLIYRVAAGKATLMSAAYMAYFSQLMLGATFRIWYPLWLIPFAALHLTSRTAWRTYLFSLTAELSIVSY